MTEAFIIDAVRTPVGRRGGGLSQVHPADLGAHSIKALIDRTGVDANAVDDVVFGNVDSVGPQAGCIARTCWLTAGLPEHVPHHNRSSMWFCTTGCAFCRTSSDEWHDGSRRCWRCAKHEYDPHFVSDVGG